MLDAGCVYSKRRQQAKRINSTNNNIYFLQQTSFIIRRCLFTARIGSRSLAFTFERDGAHSECTEGEWDILSQLLVHVYPVLIFLRFCVAEQGVTMAMQFYHNPSRSCSSIGMWLCCSDALNASTRRAHQQPTHNHFNR